MGTVPSFCRSPYRTLDFLPRKNEHEDRFTAQASHNLAVFTTAHHFTYDTYLLQYYS